MAQLYFNNQPVDSIFTLIGKNENAMTYSLAYALTHCEALFFDFIKEVGIVDFPDNLRSEVSVIVQRYEKDGGFTDVELVHPEYFHIIIEAKKGWEFPGVEQLEKYCDRVEFKLARTRKILVVLNESTEGFVRARFNHNLDTEAELRVISWRRIQEIINRSSRMGKDFQNRVLKELSLYLKTNTTMQQKNSNRVYVVSVSRDNPIGCSISFLEIIMRYGRYFHPVGGGKGGWPAIPPNYIAFRYNGHLQSIHKIDSYETFYNPADHFEEFEDCEWPLFYLYNLGPAILPPKRTPSGKKIVRSMRVWAELDLLLTADSIESARDLTLERNIQ